MKILFAFYFIVLIAGCSNSKRIIYKFESENVTDSIVTVLKKHEIVRQKSYHKLKWYALIREEAGTYDVIINEQFGEKDSPVNKLIKKSNRYIVISSLRIPLVFETDLLSVELNKYGAVNWGGYYFQIVKENGKYSVKKTSVLF